MSLLTPETIVNAVYMRTCEFDAAHGEEPVNPNFSTLPSDVQTMLLKAIQDCLDSPCTDAPTHHDYLIQQRKAEGWTVGEEYNENTKTDPDLIPFSEIDKTEQERFVVFFDAVRASELGLLVPAEAVEEKPKPKALLPDSDYKLAATVRIVYEANRAYKHVLGQVELAAWDAATPYERSLWISFVRYVISRLDVDSFDIVSNAVLDIPQDACFKLDADLYGNSSTVVGGDPTRLLNIRLGILAVDVIKSLHSSIEMK